MPNTAIAQGHVDFILSPQEIAEELGRLSRHPYVTFTAPARVVESEGERT